jgi:hypothetical protein
VKEKKMSEKCSVCKIEIEHPFKYVIAYVNGKEIFNSKCGSCIKSAWIEFAKKNPQLNGDKFNVQ